KQILGIGAQPNFKKLVSEGAVIVDVRTATEFSSGHVKGSINIPVDQIGRMTDELKKLDKPIITCCRSGARSGMAASTLKSAGINCYNGGPWNVLNMKIA
ncbi:MAG: rhodanese-like domain-containing protein, partial [Flavitalea sp.]